MFYRPSFSDISSILKIGFLALKRISLFKFISGS